MAASAVASIMADCITGQQTTHESGDGNTSGFKQEMEMIGYQRPGKTPSLCFYDQLTQASYKIVPVLIFTENLTALDTSGDDVVHSSWCINSGLSGHAALLA